MKLRTRITVAVALLLSAVQVSYAAVETFDIATFTRPTGWSRKDTNGVMLLEDQRVVQGQLIFCQIYVFPSRPGTANSGAEFQTEWDQRVFQTLGIQGHSAPETGMTPDGWMASTAFADFVKQGTPTRAILASGTGFGKVVSVVVLVSPNAYQAEVEQFLLDITFHGNTSTQSGPNTIAQAAPPSGAGGASGGSLNRYVYVAPQQWTRQNSSDGILLVSPNYPNERCQLLMLPLRPASAALADDAIGTFRQLFKADPLSTYPSPPPNLARGISPQGWEYFEIKKLVGGQEGEARTMGTIVLNVRLGNEIATVIGTSKDFMVSQCFGLLQPDSWPAFFYSLQFSDSSLTGQSQSAMRQRLAGTWLAATASAGVGFTFMANGRYGTIGAVRHDYAQTQEFYGDGSYSFDGSRLVLTGNDQRRTVYWFRLQQVSRNSGQSWQDALCLMSPGDVHELCYRKG
jgi:hypothetical protein